MDYNRLIAITGLSGLFELVTSKSDGAVVRSLEDKTSKFVSNRQHSFSHLESIEIYTVRENVNLADIFLAMKENGTTIPDHKADPKEIKAYFEKVYPELDFERVYASDMKKMVRWYDILTRSGVEITRAEAGAEEAATEKAPEKTEKKAPVRTSEPKATAKSAPVKKVNAPRKMA